MVNPLPATRTKLAAFKGWGSHVEYEAVVVVGMPTVNPLYMGSSLLVVHCFSRVRWKQALSTYLSIYDIFNSNAWFGFIGSTPDTAQLDIFERL